MLIIFKGKQVLENYNPELAGLGARTSRESVNRITVMLDKAKNIGLGTLEKGAQYAKYYGISGNFSKILLVEL
jgi:hypothetical protein